MNRNRKISCEGTQHGSAVQWREYQVVDTQTEFKSHHHCQVLIVEPQPGPSIFYVSVFPHLEKWCMVDFNEPPQHFYLFSFCFKYTFPVFFQEFGTVNVSLFLDCGHTQTFSCLLSPNPVLWGLQFSNCKCKADFCCILTYCRALRASSSSDRMLLMEWTGGWGLSPITESFIHWRPDGL